MENSNAKEHLDELDKMIAFLSDFPNSCSCDYLHERGSFLQQLCEYHWAESVAYMQTKDVSSLFKPLQGGKVEHCLPKYCHVLKQLFRLMSPQVIFHKYEKYLVEAISQDSPDEILELAFFLLSKCVKDGKVCALMVASDATVAALLTRLEFEKFSHNATSILHDMVLHVPDAYKAFFKSEHKPIFERIRCRNTISKLRLYELYCNVATLSSASYGKFTPQLDEIFHSFRNESSDVILRLNYVELFTVMVLDENTALYVIDAGIVDDLGKFLDASEEAGSMHYLPSVFGFFGAFGQTDPQAVCDNYSDCLKRIIAHTESGGFKAPAFRCMGQIGRTQIGKRCLKKKINLNMIDLMKNIGEVLEGDADESQREAALDGLAFLMEVEDVEQRDLMPITLQWFSMAGERPLQALWNNAKSHFREIKLAAFRALRNIAILSWGRDALLEECAGFYEWLINRTTEEHKDCMEAKFAVVAALLEQSNRIIDAEKRAGLRVHFSLGPFYFGNDVLVMSD